MKLILVLIATLLFAFSYGFKKEYIYSPKGGEIFTANLTYPLYSPGPVSVTVNASYDIEMCFQESFALQGSLTDCNPGGYLFFSYNSSSATSNTETVTFDAFSGLRFRDFDNPDKLSQFTTYATPATNTFFGQVYLRAGSIYFLSVRYNYSYSVNTTNSWAMLVQFPDPCPSGQVGLPLGGCQSYLGNSIAPNTTTVQTPATVKANQINYYQLQTSSSFNSIVIQARLQTSALAAADASNNFQLLLKRGSVPNITNYDAISTFNSTTNITTVSFSQPISGAWYLGINNPSNADINVAYNTTATVCPTNFTGPNCNVSLNSITDLTGNKTLQSLTGTGDYQYFKIRSNTLLFGAATQKLDVTGPSVRASFLNLPINSSYLVGASGNEINFVWATVDPSQGNVTWYVSVWFNDGEDYEVWANINCANLCEGDDYQQDDATAQGTCDSQAGMCICDDGYGELTCTKTGLAVVWIVLIVIASLLVLGVAIGVPVGCYLKNKRKARYERV